MSEITIRLPKFLSFGHKVFDLRSGLSGSPRADILSGLTVALALVPEAVAFSFLAGVPPLVGLYAAFIICLLTSILGGRPGMISGATGAMGVVVVALVADHGIGYHFPAVMLCGLNKYRKMLLKGHSVVEMENVVSKTMEDYAPRAMATLEKRFNLLVLVASVSPLFSPGAKSVWVMSPVTIIFELRPNRVKNISI